MIHICVYSYVHVFYIYIYGDASGAKFSFYGPLIRCVIGLVKVVFNSDNNIYREWGVQLNLPGLLQTVPRAESYALQYLLNEATENANIKFVTDTKKIVILSTKVLKQAQEV